MDEEQKLSVSFSNVAPTQINEAALVPRDEFNFTLLFIGLGAVLLIGVAIGGYLYHRRRQMKSAGNNPLVLFRELCDGYSLSWRQRQSLLRLARIRKVTNPCLIIFDPGLWPSVNDALSDRSFANRISELHRVLFDALPVAPAEAAKA